MDLSRKHLLLGLVFVAGGCSRHVEPAAHAAASEPTPPACVVYQPPRRACCHGPVVKVHCCAPTDRAVLRSTDLAAGTPKLLGEGAADDGECTYTFELADGTQARAKLTRWDAKTQKLDELVASEREAGHHVTPLGANSYAVEGDGERGAWIATARFVAHLQVDEVLLDPPKFVALVKTVSARLASP